ncbi:Lipase-like PAD4 [Sesamum alatum]|uniref:Lipase-like PAD4 n=1 Tax=Sesamum alatum TaxID=300844 RepID=A0AAE1YAQ1_9LAMI|nr:Lipase-like PAD4 [Sesamum alatum]
MAPETSQFESSEMLATFLASTPLLEESWRLCSHANAAAQRSFAVNVVGQVAYVAFSAVQMVESGRNLVELERCGRGILGSFPCHVEGKKAVMVDGGLLQLFLSFYSSQAFQNKISEIFSTSKSVVLAGHSLGGGVASLSALWLLSHIRTTTTKSSPTVFCITYGSPMLGNEPFSQAVLQDRWGGNFCHIVAQHDIVPRLPFASSFPLDVERLRGLFVQLALQLSDENKAELFDKVLASRFGPAAGDDQERSWYWPFGSYMICTDKGAVCLDNGTAIVKLLYLMLAEGSANSCIDDHLKYEDYVSKVCLQYLQKRRLFEVSSSESSSESGIALALQSSRISSHQEPVFGTAVICLATARQLGWRRNLNTAKMAVSLSKINPFRAELEWYKTYCDRSDDQLGYYDSFKRRGASKRDFKVNMNRLRLGCFWDDVIYKLEKNQLAHDFHKLPKYVNASQFYKLLVEPLEIAEYYRTGVHREKGHYVEHGREKRFKIFDRWWGDRKVGDEESKPRSKYASLTQDSCFWAKVEEARDLIYNVTRETDPGRHLLLLDKIQKFEQYANGMIERKEVSVDVLAKNSSYNLFREEWSGLKSQLQLLPSQFPGFQDGMVQ